MAKKRAQAVAFLLVVILVLSLNAQAFAAEDARPGDVNYELSGDTLVISGSGTVQNGDIMQAVLEPSAIDKIVVCEGITGIGNWAFRSVFVNLSDIKLPKSLISIGIGAFEDCTALTRI